MGRNTRRGGAWNRGRGHEIGVEAASNASFHAWRRRRGEVLCVTLALLLLLLPCGSPGAV